jgi:hypothetical protein
MRIRPERDGWVVDAVYVHGPKITASVLQAVPISRVGQLARLDPPDDDDPAGLADWLKRTFGVPAIPMDFGELGGPVNPSTEMLEGRAAQAPASLELPEVADTRESLTRPDGSDPAGFYVRVAQAYREYAPRNRAPAVEIAKEAGVPVATARSWIREARRRGALPPGHQGKAG